MTVEESLQQFGLVPSDESLPRIREILLREAEIERDKYRAEAERLYPGGEREEDLALLCCVQLFSRGLLDDVLAIWYAKMSSFDLGCYLDYQFLCGAGVDTTLEYLRNHADPEAASALDYLEERHPFDEGWTPESHLQNYRRYFGVEVPRST